MPGLVELSLPDPQHGTSRQGPRDVPKLLRVRQRDSGQESWLLPGPPGDERIEILRAAGRLEDHGQRLLVGLQPRGDFRIVFRGPWPLLGSILLVPEDLEHGPITLEIKLEANRQVGACSDVVGTILRWL